MSQSVTPDILSSSGDFYANANGMVQWTLGELMVETYNTSGYFATQGFHQTDNFTTGVPVSLPDNEVIGFYPNPASDHLTINFGDNSQGNYHIDIYNSIGQIVHTEEFSASNFSQLEIGLDGLANGAYLMRMTNKDSDKIKSFQFDKIF